MPHLILECSESLQNAVDIHNAMHEGRQVLVASEQFKPGDIKVRCLVVSDYLLSEPYTDFLHVTLKLLNGRDISVRAQLSDSLFSCFHSLIDATTTQLSVDLVEMTKETYRKSSTPFV